MRLTAPGEDRTPPGPEALKEAIAGYEARDSAPIGTWRKAFARNCEA